MGRRRGKRGVELDKAMQEFEDNMVEDGYRRFQCPIHPHYTMLIRSDCAVECYICKNEKRISNG
jgi:hypothetical protein